MQVIKQQLYGRVVSCVEPQTPRGIEPGFFWISEPNGPSGHSASARRLVFHALSTPAPFVPGRTRLYTSATVRSHAVTRHLSVSGQVSPALAPSPLGGGVCRASRGIRPRPSHL